jgi:flavin reductase (DIM6/NTAB) family NADH-FMN oxidoreductase RutF/DNA-binding GntR family transcriptional regulator
MTFTDVQGRDRLSAEEFRDVIGRFASGVTVITTTLDGTPYGTTASAVSSLSLEPPMLLICMNKESSTGAAVAATRHFAVNILGEDEPDLAMHFASKSSDKFATVAHAAGDLGDPLLERAMATLECRVTEEVTGGTHTVFLAEVDRAFARHGSPLAYFRGKFGRLELAQDESAFAVLRACILSREVPVGEPLELDALAEQLDAPRGAVYHALARLYGEGLATRDPASGAFVIEPVTIAAAESALRARHAILLGVAALTVGETDPEAIANLRELLERVAPTREDGSLLPYPEWRQALVEFQKALVGLTRSDALAEAFARANVAAMIALHRGNVEPKEADRVALRRGYRLLLDAYEAGDLQAARVAAREIIDQAAGDVRAAFAADTQL